MFRNLFLVFILFYMFSIASYSNELQTELNSTYELSFVSDYNYANPYADAEFYVDFTAPSGDKYKVYGFWNGSNIFKVRFMPRQIGEWTWNLFSEVSEDIYLQSKSGSFSVIESSKDNNFIQKGIPRVSDNHRYLTYENGEPLFMINEIAWRLPLSSLKEEVLMYIKDRKSKGINAVSMTILDTFRDWGDSLRSGTALFKDYKNNEINPEFFEYIDWCINTINDSGMTVLLTPLWGSVSEVNFEPSWQEMYFEKEKSLFFAKYCASRYAGNNLIWIIGGDCNYNREGSYDFWNRWAEIVKKYSGGQQLITAHTIGYSGSYDYFNNNQWLDFHTYQSSHVIGIDYSWKGGQRSWTSEPFRPSINLEPSFEDLYEFRNDDLKIRIDYSDNRKAMYESIFSGAISGLSYSANGIFNWYSPELNVGFEPRFKIDSAILLPGSGQLYLIRDFCLSIGWPYITPALEFQIRNENEQVVAACYSDSFFTAYVPANKLQVHFDLSSLVEQGFSYKWINPIDLSESGEIIMAETSLDNITFTPPDTNVRILLVKRNSLSNISETNFQYNNIYPNPVSQYFEVNYNFDSVQEIRIVSSNGDELYEDVDYKSISKDKIRIDLKRKLAKGAYYLIIKIKGNSKVNTHSFMIN